jgi:hypothetical protein
MLGIGTVSRMRRWERTPINLWRKEYKPRAKPAAARRKSCNSLAARHLQTTNKTNGQKMCLRFCWYNGYQIHFCCHARCPREHGLWNLTLVSGMMVGPEDCTRLLECGSAPQTLDFPGLGGLGGARCGPRPPNKYILNAQPTRFRYSLWHTNGPTTPEKLPHKIQIDAAQRKGPGGCSGAFRFAAGVMPLAGRDVRRTRAFSPLPDLEVDLLAFIQ